MEEKTLKAGDNPDLANDIVKDVLESKEEERPKANIKEPFDGTVLLPAGHVTASGEAVQTAEVRELNGHDEEVIVRNSTMAKALNTMVERATVKIGDEKPTQEMLDNLPVGDRNALLLGIYRATFGEEIEVKTVCRNCNIPQDVLVKVDEDIPVKSLVDPVNDRRWQVVGKNEYVCQLPTGKAQKAMVNKADVSAAEMQTTLLEHCVVTINGQNVFSRKQVLDLPLKDRRKLVESINDRAPGPVFEDLTVTCPDCDAEVGVPISIGAFFRF